MLSDLNEMLSILNTAHSGKKQKDNSHGGFQVDLYAGAVQYSFPTSFNGYYLSNYQFQLIIRLLEVQIFYSIPGDFKAFKVGLSIGYSSYSKSYSENATRKDSVTCFFIDHNI